MLRCEFYVKSMTAVYRMFEVVARYDLYMCICEQCESGDRTVC